MQIRQISFIFGICLAAMSTIARSAEIVARLVDPFTASQVAQTYGIELIDSTAPAPFVLFSVPSNLDPGVVQSLMLTDSRVVWVEDQSSFEFPEHQSSTGGTVGAVFDPLQTFARNDSVWKQIHFSNNRPPRLMPVLVGIVDTGLSRFQPTLWKRVMFSANFATSGIDANDVPTNVDSNGNGTPDEAAGHGTMVAGIIAQIAGNARFVIARVADSDGNATNWTLIKGVAYSVMHGCKIINISLGSMSRLNALTDVAEWVDQQGGVIIAPAGNHAQSNALFPARMSKAICVTGLLPSNVKAPFSNWDNGADVAAPATGIQSAWWDGQSAVWSGTSFAAPLAAGALANAAGVTGLPSPSGIRSAFQLSGVNIDPLNPSYSGRLGKLLDADALYKRLGASH